MKSKKVIFDHKRFTFLRSRESAEMQSRAERVSKTQREWAERGLLAARSIFPLMAPISTYPRWNENQHEAITYLLTATARTSESAFLLCYHGQLWDADILMRSVLEGTLKFSYLLCSRDGAEVRAREYSDELFYTALAKDHHKIANLLSALADPSGPDWFPLRQRLLKDDELNGIRARLSKTQQQDMERRWGFTGLIGTLSRSGEPGFKNFGAFAHSYALASHLQHVDTIGASLPLEREQRAEEQRLPLELAHTARLVSDALTLLYLRVLVGYRFVDADLQVVAGAKRIIDEACSGFDEAYAAWMSAEYGDNIG